MAVAKKEAKIETEKKHLTLADYPATKTMRGSKLFGDEKDGKKGAEYLMGGERGKLQYEAKGKHDRKAQENAEDKVSLSNAKTQVRDEYGHASSEISRGDIREHLIKEMMSEHGISRKEAEIRATPEE